MKQKILKKIEKNISFWIQIIYYGTSVTIFNYIGRNISNRYASILYSLPYTMIIVIIMIMTYNYDYNYVREYAMHILIASFGIIIFSLSFYYINKYFKIKLYNTLLLSLIFLSLFAVLIYYKPYYNYVNKLLEIKI